MKLNTNQLIIGQGHDHPELYSKNITARQLHWITKTPVKFPFEFSAKIRYRQKDQSCVIEKIEDGLATISFIEKQFAPTPGQSVVFYKDAECLGGGIIETV